MFNATFAGPARQRDTGRSVNLYQQALSVWGVPLKPDGAFGPKTAAAVEQYQRAAQLISPYVDHPDPLGVIGGLTAANLARYVPAALYVPAK